MDDTYHKLIDLIRSQHKLDVSNFTRSTSLEDVGLDSLAVAELLFSIEDTFKVRIGDIDQDTLPATLGEVAKLIDAKLGAA